MEIDDDDRLTELEFGDDEGDVLDKLRKKLANEREKLQRPDSESSTNDDGQLKLQQAMLRRQELLDRIKHEQVLDCERPRTYSPRRRYTPSPLPPPSRRSLPDLSRAYHFNWYQKQPQQDMAQTKHIIEHQFRPPDQSTQKTYVLPPIQNPPQVTTIQTPSLVQQVPAVQYADFGKPKDTMFNKSDFMDMMMLQNAQMHHMVMQQMMLQNLPGGGGGGGSFRLPTAQVPMAPVMAEPMMRAAPMYASAPAPVIHHHVPPMEYRGAPGPSRAYNTTIYDDASNYYTYH